MAIKKRVAVEFSPLKGKTEIIDREHIAKDNLINYLLQMKESDVTYSFIMDLFGEFNGKRLCNPYDYFEVPVGSFRFINGKGKEVSNKNVFITTIGLWIYNVFFFRDDGLTATVGYVNKTISKKGYNEIEESLSYALLEDKITTDQFKRYLEKTQFFMPFETIISPNQTEHMLTCTKVINKKKQELYKKYKDQIEAGNVAVAEQMEKELLAFATEYMGDDPSLDTLVSGGGGSFGNNFKNMFVMKGAIRNPDPNAKQRYNVMMSNYMDGISADEYSLFANSLAAGPYSRGKKTETGGYWEKLFVSALQYIVFDEPGTDCGTPHYITVELTKKNYKEYMYNYIIVGNGGLEELTSDNLNKFIGKRVKMRFSSMCRRTGGKGKICHHCAGNFFYRLGIKNGGVACSTIASIMKNRCMKGFHDSTISTVEIDPMKAFGLRD